MHKVNFIKMVEFFGLRPPWPDWVYHMPTSLTPPHVLVPLRKVSFAHWRYSSSHLSLHFSISTSREDAGGVEYQADAYSGRLAGHDDKPVFSPDVHHDASAWYTHSAASCSTPVASIAASSSAATEHTDTSSFTATLPAPSAPSSQQQAHHVPSDRSVMMTGVSNPADQFNWPPYRGSDDWTERDDEILMRAVFLLFTERSSWRNVAEKVTAASGRIKSADECKRRMAYEANLV
ncbi:hypothetical protein BDZ85DRAFT_259586 [Elsinoe ampelina]|uniref:Myb-like domain-containing protein n=1 Tax=Elsinoe ampelina TaxID=302913 RepID=A0A6A6GHA9_9PEZI|nr:hypothetical protein BDZ85DRAFT_259586 [Elsinoe ampelina]